MRWRDIRFEKPTEADGDRDGSVLQLLCEGSVGSYHYANDCDCIAWMPLSELPAFTPIPDPPEGWRFVDKGEAFDKRAKYWGLSKHWAETWHDYDYAPELVYIVPIDPPKPPEPQYRPFANAAEFLPYRDKWWRYKSMTATDYYPPVFFGDKGHGKQHWADSFENKVFEDGTPFGVKVEP
jgi:hypothetical protein